LAEGQGHRSQADLWDELYPALHEGCQHSPLHRSLARLLRRKLGKLAYASLLDVGCGDGSKLTMLALPAECSVLGLDVSAEAVALAKMTFATGTFEVFDIEREVPSGWFDAIICSEVLEHLEADVTALRHMREVCSGTLIITVPGQPYDAIGRQVGHVRHYTKSELREKLVLAGFEVVALNCWGFPFHTLYRVILNRFSDESRLKMGGGSEVGMSRRVVMWLIYQMFKLNVFPLGREIIAVARPI